MTAINNDGGEDERLWRLTKVQTAATYLCGLQTFMEVCVYAHKCTHKHTFDFCKSRKLGANIIHSPNEPNKRY